MFNMVRGAARPSSIVLALVAMLPLAAQAADSPIAWATTKITGLQYLLVDLDPTDGVAPSATFNGAFYLNTASSDWSDWETMPKYSGSLAPTTTVSATDADSSVQASPDGWSTSSSLSASTVLAQFDGSSGSFQTRQIRRYTNLASSSIDDPTNEGMSITLGAKTALYIGGIASIAGQTDWEQLATTLSVIAPYPAQQSSQATIDAGVRVYLGKIQFEMGSIAPIMESRTESVFTFNSPFFETSFDRSQPFSVHFANFESAATELSFDLDVYAAAHVEASVNLQAIPEPSTWALLAGGLISLGLVRRRQRR